VFSDQTFLYKGDCIVDLTFEYTDSVNKWILETVERQNVYIWSSSFGIDFITIASLVVWTRYNRTIRLAFCLVSFYFIRGRCQKYFYMMRYEDLVQRYPGIPSLTIGYFDLNDFYFSGHIGSSTFYTMEMWALGHKKMTLVGVLIVIYEWIFMIFSRQHFIIDMLSGLVISLSCHRLGEMLCYPIECWVIRQRKARRETFWYKVCGRCGWLCCDASKLVSENELVT